MALPEKIESKEIESFIKIFNHQYGGKNWSVDQFLKGLNNWIKPKKSCAGNPVEQSTEQQCNIAVVSGSLHFTANDVDGAYLLGVFNTTGLDGLAKELARLKELKMNPSTMLEILKWAEQ